MSTNDGRGPFSPAAQRTRRLKCLVWGDSGVGKTTLALQFPSPVLLDLEAGADLYGRTFEFGVLTTTDFEEVLRGVEWLASSHHPYQTLIIDPVTVLWEQLQWKWSNTFLRRNSGSRGHKYEFYDFQPRDWMTIKAEWRELMRRLIELPMHVVVTAREKAQYSDSGFMKVVGVTIDGPRDLPHIFDTVVHLSTRADGTRIATTNKDRSNQLPLEEFECSFEVFERAFELSATPPTSSVLGPATEVQVTRIREAAEDAGLSPAELRSRLCTYGATSLDELTAHHAGQIIQAIDAAKQRQEAAAAPRKE